MEVSGGVRVEGTILIPNPINSGYIDILGCLVDNWGVKLARPPLVQFWKQSTGGTSGLHRAA